jgi:hypothetical protein
MTAMIMMMLVQPSQFMKQAILIGSQRDIERNREVMVDNRRKPNIIREMHSRRIQHCLQWHLESILRISILVSGTRMLQVQLQLLEVGALSCRVSHGELGSKSKVEVSSQQQMRPNNQLR